MKVVRTTMWQKADEAVWCLFVRTRWEPAKKGSRQMHEYFIDTVCRNPNKYAFDVKRYKPQIVEFDKPKHGNKMCTECVTQYRARKALLKRG